MKYRLILSVILTFITSLVAFGQVHNIDLLPGHKTVMKGVVKSGEGKEQLYIFEARPGQQLTVHIASVNRNAIFSVNEQYRVDHPPIEIDGQAIESKDGKWSGELPQSESNGLFSVSVTSTRGSATFTLEITLGIAEPEPADSSDTESDPGNVQDYYLMMPEKYDGLTRSEREETIKSTETFVDIENGYIGSDVGTLGERFQAAIFKRLEGGYIFAYNEDGDPSANVATKLYLLKYADGRWMDVTTQLLPVPVNKSYHFDLPQKGTTVNVTNAAGKKLYSLIWRNGRFEKR